MNEMTGGIAIILICGLFADSLLMKGRLKDLEAKIKDIDKRLREK